MRVITAIIVIILITGVTHFNGQLMEWEISCFYDSTAVFFLYTGYSLLFLLKQQIFVENLGHWTVL